MATQRKYLQLTCEDRRLISHWRARGFGVNEIARRMNVDQSTISRELRRNGRKITREDQLFWQEVCLAGSPPGALSRVYRSRECLGYLTPLEVHFKKCSKISLKQPAVALVT